MECTERVGGIERRERKEEEKDNAETLSTQEARGEKSIEKGKKTETRGKNRPEGRPLQKL